MSEKITAADKQQEKTNWSGIGTLSDLGIGLLDGAVAKPYNATLGLVLPKMDLSESYDKSSIAGRVGDFGGTVADIVILSKLTGGLVNKGLGTAAEKGIITRSLAESNMLASSLSMGTTGALYNGVFTPGSATDRLKHATAGFATFSTLGVATAGLGKFQFLGQSGSRTFMQNVKLGGLSGLPAGFVDAQASSLMNGKGINTDVVEVGKSMGYYGLFGATMGGAAHGAQEYGPRARMWLSENMPKLGTQAPAENIFRSPQTLRPTEAEPIQKVAEVPIQQPKKFNIPENGIIDLGKMIQEAAPADRIALIQEVIKARPQVPVGSWMRHIEEPHMEAFLRAGHQMYPETTLRTVDYLLQRRMVRPITDSQTINFDAWEQALKKVQSGA
jgi:hypothetical protein